MERKSLRDHGRRGAPRRLSAGWARSGYRCSVNVVKLAELRHTALSVDEVLTAVHRLGELGVGDIAVVVAAACPHRAEAFEACRALIDNLKNGVPIWKHQLFGDGSSEWVGSA